MTIEAIEQEIINAETLEDLLKCLEKIEEQIWNNKKYEKVFAYAQGSKLLDKIKEKPMKQDLIPILQEYINTKSSFEALEEKCKEFVFAQLSFVIVSAISLINDATIKILLNPIENFLGAFLQILIVIGIIFTLILPIELFIFCCFFLVERPRQIKHKAFYNFALKKL